jgi:hypothetical protein
MATQDDVRQIALSLPGADEADDYFTFFVTVKEKHKGFVWAWRERIDPKKARVPSTRVIAARTTSVAERDLMVSQSPTYFFTEPHYAGFPAVLVRLDTIPRDVLEFVILEAWRCLAPRELAALVGEL